MPITPRLMVTPAQALFDEPIQIRATGLPPGPPVTIRATMVDFIVPGDRWESHAIFFADTHGVVDLAQQAPTEGSYQERNPMGLFSSMALQSGDLKGPHLTALRPTPTRITLTVEVAGKVVATETVERIYRAPGVTARKVEEQGVIGEFYQAAGRKSPVVITLSGAEGGYAGASSLAALLASHGISALALGYFGLPGLPSALNHIPLETVERAITWLQQQAGLDLERLGILGVAKGGELALLAASTFPQIRAVVGLTPSGVLLAGLQDSFAWKSAPSWTYRGKPLPYVPFKVTPGFVLSALGAAIRRKPIPLIGAYQASLQNEEAVARATIPVERINGPVLLVTGEDDQIWPAPRLARQVIDRLKALRHPYPIRQISYPGVGHTIPLPYVPSVPGPGAGLALTGDPEADAAAGADAWQQVLAFYTENLARAKISA